MSFTHKVRTAIVGLDPARTRFLEKLLARWMQVVSVRPELRDALAPVVGARPRAVLLYLGTHHATAMQIARRIREELPDAALVLLADHEEDGTAREAIRLGARAFVVFGADDAELTSLFVGLSEEAEHPQTCFVLGVYGAKGGVGTSTLAMNLASCMARTFAARGLLLDLAPCLGELGLFLDMDTPYGLLDLVQSLHRVDDEQLQQVLTRHRHGFHLLGQPMHRVPETVLDGEMLLRGLRILRRHFGWIVLDMGGVLDERSLTGAVLSDRVVLLSTPDLPSLVGARRRLDVLLQEGRGTHDIALVLNRTTAQLEAEVRRAREVMGVEVSGWLSDDAPTVLGSLESARVLFDHAPEARLTQQIAALSARLSGAGVVEQKQPNPAESRRKWLFGIL